MKSFKEARQDPHRPSVLDPAEYVYVGCADDHGGDSYFEMNHSTLRAHGIDTGINNRHSAAGVPWYDATQDGRPNFRCHHCGKHGSNIRYFTFFLHKPTSVVITVGQICAKKLNLGTKEELDLQKRANAFRTAKERGRWVEDHKEEADFLAAYDEAHRAGGRYNEFFASLFEQLQQKGSLSDKQVIVLHQGMEREKRWQAENADRKLGEVTRTDDPPTEKQLSFINRLMDDRQMPDANRKAAREKFDAGLTKAQAGRWIERLLALPKIGEAA